VIVSRGSPSKFHDDPDNLRLRWDDRVVDLDLIQPACMDGQMDEDQRRLAALAMHALA